MSKSRLDIVNNFHARMLSSAILAARSPELEYVQIVSFGCGHDAYLSDEIIRLMREISGKDAPDFKAGRERYSGAAAHPRPLLSGDPVHETGSGEKPRGAGAAGALPGKIHQARKGALVLVPNTSHAFSRIMSAAMPARGLRTDSLEVGREEAIRLGKQYVHNDICFPAQMVIGEALAALKSGKYDAKHVAIGMGKYMGDCRLTHYGALLSKALDDAGFSQVPILTNDDQDATTSPSRLHMNLLTSMRIAFALPMIDALEELLQKDPAL